MKKNGGINEGILNALFAALLLLFFGLITHKITFVPPKPDLNIDAGDSTLLNHRVVAECSRADVGLAQLTVIELIREGVPADLAVRADLAIVLVPDKSSDEARRLITTWNNQYPSINGLRVLDAESYEVSK